MSTDHAAPGTDDAAASLGGDRMKLGSAIRLLAAGAALVAVLRRIRRFGRRISFAGSTVLITGGSRGLGLVLARMLAEKGANIALVARDEDELERAKADLEKKGATVMIIARDLSDEEEAKEIVELVVAHFGRLDVLVNNAGVIQVGPIEHMSLGDFEEAMDVHLWAPLHLMLAAIPRMRDQGGGRIVNIASLGGRIAMPHLAPYCASKSALVGLSEAVRTELSRHNIFVTTVYPSLIRTGSVLNAKFKGRHEEEYTWFAISDSLPFLSMSAERAAGKILDAVRHGDASERIGPMSHLAMMLEAAFPELLADILAVINHVLPGRAQGGDQVQTGWESRSRWAPSLLTRLTDEAAERNNEVPMKPESIS
jgi:short-subunit dehydrogenase